jgi:hypothetical protein
MCFRPRIIKLANVFLPGPFDEWWHEFPVKLEIDMKHAQYLLYCDCHLPYSFPFPVQEDDDGR